MVWLFPSHMSSELHYHNIPDIKLKTVGTSIVDICATFKTKELPVVSLIPAKLRLLPHSSFYNANFFFFSSLANAFTRSQLCSCRAPVAVAVWAGPARSHTEERRGCCPAFPILEGLSRDHWECAVPGNGKSWCSKQSGHPFFCLSVEKKSVKGRLSSQVACVTLECGSQRDCGTYVLGSFQDSVLPAVSWAMVPTIHL